MAAAIRYLQFSRTADLACETNTTCAHHAPVREQSDLLANMILIHPLDLGLVQSANRIAILVRVVLQITFARLIANRAIEWMIEQQQLERHLLSRLDLLRIGANDRSLSDRGLATRHQFGTHDDTAVRLCFANLD